VLGELGDFWLTAGSRTSYLEENCYALHDLANILREQGELPALVMLAEDCLRTGPFKQRSRVFISHQ
jgi:hypothetical protein